MVTYVLYQAISVAFAGVWPVRVLSQSLWLNWLAFPGSRVRFRSSPSLSDGEMEDLLLRLLLDAWPDGSCQGLVELIVVSAGDDATVTWGRMPTIAALETICPPPPDAFREHLLSPVSVGPRSGTTPRPLAWQILQLFGVMKSYLRTCT
jgi:hypothetical protein